MNKSGLLGASALRSVALFGLAIGGASPLLAQTANPNPAAAISSESEQTQVAQNDVASDPAKTTDQSIVVTGSRIRRPNLESSVPITSVGPQELTERGSVSLGDALNELPSLRTTFSQANSTAFIGTAGLNELDLRGQGTDRTLVLVNGRRHVSAVPGRYIVDVNTIPSELLERVDIVTGGNSAVYGSDAIAGVVNFVLKRNFEGIQFRGQGGVSQYGDRGTYTVGAIIGHNFLDGRMNATFAAEYAKANPLFFQDRDYLGAINDGNGGAPGFITSEISNAPNRNFDGIPNTRFINGNPGITFNFISLGGYISTSCPRTATAANAAQRALVCTGETTPTGTPLGYGFAFLPDGSLARDDAAHGRVDFRSIGGGGLGGLGATGLEGAMLIPGLERYNFNLLLHGDFSPSFRPFVEANYVRLTVYQQSTQPTAVGGSGFSPTFSINNAFLSKQARDTILLITGGAPTFNMFRFNNDIGTRSENHLRQTYQITVGADGEISQKGNLHYQAAFYYGRTTTYYKSGGTIDLAKFRNAANAVNSGGQIVCGINADAITTNDDPACVPINLFGNGAPSQAAINYVLHPATRNQRAEEIDATAFISGDSSGFFELPGGPVGFAIGGEYRRETAYSKYDDFTQSGATSLNAASTFAPPASNIKEAYAELRIPLLKDMPFFHELSIEGAGRVSNYGGSTASVWAYNAGAIWSPVRDIRFRASYAKAVRAPNLSNLYGTPSVTFANGLTDPCDQPGQGTNNANNITNGPNRVKNCAAAGIPTTITYLDAAGKSVTEPWTNVTNAGVQGINQGNLNLNPEVGRSLTFGAVFQPRFLPGFSLSVDYYRIKITNLIAGLSGQGIVNQCYDDPGGINNQYCASIFRRSAPGTPADLTFLGQSSRVLAQANTGQVILPVLGNGFINQPFNYAAEKTSGIDADMSYRTRIKGVGVNLRAIVSWVENREQFASIAVPTQSTRILSTLGDPVWQGAFSANLDFGKWAFTYNGRYVGKQIVSGLSYETFFPWQGRTPTNPEARPFAYYSPVIYHSVRLVIKPNQRFSWYIGVDNLTNKLPPYDLTGNENTNAGNSGAIYPNTGRFFYSGVVVKY